MMFSDALYFSRLDSDYLLVHFDPNVIKAMAAFCFMAIVKDAIVGGFIFIFYKGIELIFISY